MKLYDKNPLRMSKKTTSMHPNHKRKTVACKTCTNEKLLQENKMIGCTNCGLYTLCLSEDEVSIKYGAEIYCSACHMHWARTEKW